MEVKGTAVKSIPEFVKKVFPDRYYEWLDTLPAETKMIIKEGVAANKWYPLMEAAIIPTSKIGELFYNGDSLKGAWECGKYSADVALQGIYKIYVKFSKPRHIVERAGRIFSAYYNPSTLEATNFAEKSVDVVMRAFDMPSSVIEHRIGGWMVRALEISGCKDVNVTINKSLVKGDKETIYNITWS